MGIQTQYDLYENPGGAEYSLKKVSQNNPGDLPLTPTAGNLGLIGLNSALADVTSITQAVVSGTLYFSEIYLGANTPITNIGVFLGSTLAATPGTYSGFALYSAGALTASLLASTGATDTAKWVAATASAYFQDALTAEENVQPGWYGISFIVAATTTPTVVSAPCTLNTIKVGSLTVNRCLTLAAQTSFPATLTYSGMASSSFVPVMGIS